jgi:hypothetical protein
MAPANKELTLGTEITETLLQYLFTSEQVRLRLRISREVEVDSSNFSFFVSIKMFAKCLNRLSHFSSHRSIKFVFIAAAQLVEEANKVH